MRRQACRWHCYPSVEFSTCRGDTKPTANFNALEYSAEWKDHGSRFFQSFVQFRLSLCILRTRLDALRGQDEIEKPWKPFLHYVRLVHPKSWKSSCHMCAHLMLAPMVHVTVQLAPPPPQLLVLRVASSSGTPGSFGKHVCQNHVKTLQAPASGC